MFDRLYGCAGAVYPYFNQLSIGSRRGLMAKAAKSKAKRPKAGSKGKAAPKAAKLERGVRRAPPSRKPVRKPVARRPATRRTAAKPALGRGEGRIVLYGHFNSMPAAKVRLMLGLASAPFSYRHVDLSQGAQRAPEYLAMNRFGQVPVLRHGDVTLAQSNVILRYLADALGKFGGADEAERRAIEQWLDWEADLMSSGVRALRAAVRFLNADLAVRQYIRARAERALNTLDAALANRAFLAGSRPTIADIAVLPHLTVANEAEFDLAPYEHVRAWIDRMMALPGAGHPYDLMPREDRD
jgi:glutathione S-transferase